MLRHVCVAFGCDPPSEWALEHAGELTRRSGARLTLVHVAPLVDELFNETDELAAELLGRREDVRRRQRLSSMLWTMLPEVESRVRVLSGPIAFQILALLHADPPDLLVLGARPHSRGRLPSSRARALLARAPCPVVLVPRPPRSPEGRAVVLALDGGGKSEAVTVAFAVASKLAARVVIVRGPRDAHDTAALVEIEAECDAARPLLAITGGERFLRLRSRLARSRVGALLCAVGCPLLVIHPAGESRWANASPCRADSLRAS